MKCPLHLLTETCTTQRRTATVDAGGSPIETFNTNLAAIPCRIQPRSGNESPRYARESTRYTHIVYIEGGQDVVTTDRVVTTDSLTLDVQSVVDFDRQSTLIALVCEETK